MKKLLHDIQILAMLVLLMASIQSCSNDWQETKRVEVKFTATLPINANTRSFGNAKYVNTLVVGIYDDHKQEIGRKEFAFEGTTLDIDLALTQNQTYHFIFWAYNSDQSFYNTNDLTAIKMLPLSESTTFEEMETSDAFFAIKENITAIGNNNYSIELTRPLAQINVGSTETPMRATFIAKGVPDTFHPFAASTGGTTNFTWNFSKTTTKTFSVESTAYNYLAIGYLFASITPIPIEAELTLTDAEEEKIKTFVFPQVNIQANRKSNIGGGFTVE